MNEPRLRVAVFASGRGSNFQAILDAVEQDELDVDLVLCLSDRSTAHALERARSSGIETAVLDPSEFDTPDDYEETLLRELEARSVNFIALAGYLKHVPQKVVATYRGRIVNVHPALLPAFGGKGMYGRRVHEAVIEYGVHWSGATVHLVDEEYDTGPIVLQEPVPVYGDDTPEDVAARVLEVEHRLYPEALRLFALNRIRIEGRRVYVEAPHQKRQ